MAQNLDFLMITTDTLQHSLGCAILTASICSIPHPLAPLLAGPVVVLIGLGKEIYDYLHPESHTADWKDFAADLVGVAIVLIPVCIQRYLV